MIARLRVYPAAQADPAGSDDTPRDDAGCPLAEPAVRVRLGDLLPLVALAHRHNYLWLQDFLDDEVGITEDLYQVLRAFRCYRPSA